MKKLAITFLFLFFLIQSFGQDAGKQISIADAIRTNFNYDTLSSLSCINARSGIYAIRFKMDRKRRPYDFVSVNDTMSILHSFFIEAIKKSFLVKSTNKYKKGQYIQLICFTNTLHCNPFRNRENVLTSMVRDTAYNDKTNYFKEIADMLNNQLISLENSITKLHINDIDSKKLLYLPVALINNDNPAIDKSKPGFKDDTKGAKMTIDQLKQIEIQIDERKRGKKSEVNLPGS